MTESTQSMKRDLVTQESSSLLLLAYLALATLVLSWLGVCPTVFGQTSADESTSSTVTISLVKDASVGTGRIYVGDVARCSGNISLCQETSGILLTTAPQTGRTLFINQNDVVRVLEKEWPQMMVRVEGVESSRVTGVAADIKPDDVRTQLQEWLTERGTSNETMRVTVSRVIIPVGSGVRPSQSELKFPDLEGLPLRSADWVTRNLNGIRVTQFLFVNPKDAEDRQLVNGQAYFIVERMIPVASTTLPAGTILAEKDLTLQWVAFRRGLNDHASSVEQLIGRRSRQVVMNGEPLSMRNVETPLVVNRNQPVTMIVKNAGVEITAKATTIDGGIAGQVVDVVNIANKKRMRARVIDHQTVEAVAF